MIFKTYEIGIMPTNNYLLIDEKSKEGILIDCTGDFEKVNEDIEKYEAKLKYILLTHGHFDHILGCREFREKLNSKILMNKNDKILTDNVKIQCNMFGIKEEENVEIDEFIDEDTELKFGDIKIKIIETKGHTQGGISYLIDNMLFSGDTLFYEGVGRCDLPGGNFDEIVESISNKLYKLPPKTLVYPGHGKSTTIEHEMEYNYYVNKNSVL